MTTKRDGVYQTRRVVSGGKSMNVHLNNIISMLVDPIAQEANDSEEVISSEEALARIDLANFKIKKKQIESKKDSNNGSLTPGCPKGNDSVKLDPRAHDPANGEVANDGKSSQTSDKG